ncbi:uncharacterized protein LOC125748106 [Brienomyrus brachyistius]|uniref:uncharacterized protein LOC125748106 n=1 Tax=Brienomyrus brachyistius TaxID=42636 RepID=UPI0020B209A6|nr:uncharacterized protein LOC125748106 [Brienomyrus brachyistius]XP_048879897.1 uncharacterized protein LOC125748106 [Brienomyrus brachyistius]
MTMCEANTSGWKMTVFGVLGADGVSRQGNTLQFILILLLKVFLNLLVAVSCFSSLRRSLMGYMAHSVILADGLLLSVVTIPWLLGEHVDTAQCMCFVLAHASTIYSVLPLPVLLLGTLEHVSHLLLGAPLTDTRRGLAYSMLVLLLWALACLYSSSVTNTVVWHIHPYQLCMIHESSVVTYFSIGLCLLTLCVLITFRQEATVWIRESHKYTDSCPTLKHSDLTFTYKKVQDLHIEGVSPAFSWTGQDRMNGSAFLLSLVFGFATSWGPFLFITTAFWLLDFNAPSYISFNLLWLMCANSLVVGVIFASCGKASGLSVLTLDEICDWEMCRALVRQDRLARGISTISEKTRAAILRV